jgi:hypothetical protein
VKFRRQNGVSDLKGVGFRGVFRWGKLAIPLQSGYAGKGKQGAGKGKEGLLF